MKIYSGPFAVCITVLLLHKVTRLKITDDTIFCRKTLYIRLTLKSRLASYSNCVTVSASDIGIIFFVYMFFPLRSLFPAFTSLTNVPTIHFVYDIFTERQEEIENLLDTVKKEIEEFEQRNN